MGDMENYFLVFIGILVVCLIVSVLLFKKNIGGQFGFKYMDGQCKKVDEAPRGIAGQDGTVYSNMLACQQNTGGRHPLDIMSYKCEQMQNGGIVQRKCVPVPGTPFPQEGIYGTQVECNVACNPAK
jgi:hypothetical protein